MASCWILLRGDSLTLNLVGFYAGLNLIAWGMIFCFVRETKQLTLEEIDRKLKSRPTLSASYADASHRGLLDPNEAIHLV